MSSKPKEQKLARQRELTEKLRQAARAYYQESREIMTNQQYDDLYDELKALEEETGITLAGSPTVTVGYEVLSELKEIAGRGGISCACGSRRYSMDVRPGAVDLVCRDCGAKLRLPAVTDEDLDQLCCRYTLTIPGKPRAEEGHHD